MLLFYSALIDTEEDELVFEHIYYTYRKRMFYIAKKILGSAEDAEDAVQNALLGIAKSIQTVPTGDEEELRAYVYTVSRNAALAMCTAKQRREQEVPILFDMPDPGPDLFEQLIRQEDYEMLRRLISVLPVQYKEVMTLRFVSDISQKEIAALLHRKIGTVNQQLIRSKKLLAALYEKEVGNNG